MSGIHDLCKLKTKNMKIWCISMNNMHFFNAKTAMFFKHRNTYSSSCKEEILRKTND